MQANKVVSKIIKNWIIVNNRVYGELIKKKK